MLWTKGTYSVGRTKVKAALYERRQAAKKGRRALKKLNKDLWETAKTLC